MIQKSKHPNHVCNCKRTENDPIVQNGLALTPARMLELTQQGFSISAQNARFLKDMPMAPYSRMDVPFEFRRGVDVLADGYQMQQEIRKKVRQIQVPVNPQDN